MDIFLLSLLLHAVLLRVLIQPSVVPPTPVPEVRIDTPVKLIQPSAPAPAPTQAKPTSRKPEPPAPTPIKPLATEALPGTAPTVPVPTPSVSAPASGTGFMPNGVETLRGDSVQDALRVFGIWKRKFNKSDELSLRAYVQSSQQELNTRRLAFNSAGTLTTTTLENASRDDREILLGLRYKATLNPQHQLSTGGEASVRKRNDQQRETVNGVVSNSALGDALDLIETRSALYL